MIQDATEEDIPEISRLSERIQGNSGKPDEYRNALHDPNLIIKVIKEPELIGYVFYRSELDDMEIDEIVIDEKVQGKGYGKSLLKQVLDDYALTHSGTCFLEVRSKNQRAIALYESLGFTFYRLRKNYYGDDDALCYKRGLNL